MNEHMDHHHHDEDSACGVAHSPVAPGISSVPAERTLVAVFASPVAGYLLRYGADMGFRSLLLEPDEARAAGAAALGFPLLTAIPDDLDGLDTLAVGLLQVVDAEHDAVTPGRWHARRDASAARASRSGRSRR